MKRLGILGLAALLVLAVSSFASAANYIGVGIGMVGAEEGGSSGADRGIIGTLSADFDLMDKLTLSGHGYVEYKNATTVGLTDGAQPTFGYLVEGYVKYALANFDTLKVGAAAGVMYNSEFAPASETGFDYGVGAFAEQALGDAGTIFAQGTYWLQSQEFGGLGGVKFGITEKIAVKGQIEYVNQHTLFSIGAGYQF
ncbi:MAG: hypothetical protein NUW23_00035 [Firmicutes bacterium]|nr:hypothetical protein [Bacillota bacterium]